MTSAGYARTVSDSSLIALRSAAGATLIAATIGQFCEAFHDPAR